MSSGVSALTIFDSTPHNRYSKDEKCKRWQSNKQKTVFHKCSLYPKKILSRMPQNRFRETSPVWVTLNEIEFSNLR